MQDADPSETRSHCAQLVHDRVWHDAAVGLQGAGSNEDALQHQTGFRARFEQPPRRRSRKDDGLPHHQPASPPGPSRPARSR